MNPDVSHVTAYWKSEIIEILIKEIIRMDTVERKKNREKIQYNLEHNILTNDIDENDNEIDKNGNKIDKNGEKNGNNGKSKEKIDAMEVLDKAEKHVNKRLQMKEGLFRTYLAKHMEFRRVPRIFFQISDGKGLKQEILMTENSDLNSGNLNSNLNSSSNSNLNSNLNSDLNSNSNSLNSNLKTSFNLNIGFKPEYENKSESELRSELMRHMTEREKEENYSEDGGNENEGKEKLMNE